MKYDTHQKHYRLTAETKEDEEFLEFLNGTFENCATEKKRYWRPALVKATGISKDNGKKYIYFEVSSFNFKIVNPIKLDVIVDDERPKCIISRLVLTPARKKD